MTINWDISHGAEKISINMGHIEQAISAACSTLTKEICFNEKIKDNPAQKKAYEVHVSVLRLVEKVFQEGYARFEEHQRKMIPRKHGK